MSQLHTAVTKMLIVLLLHDGRIGTLLTHLPHDLDAVDDI